MMSVKHNNLGIEDFVVSHYNLVDESIRERKVAFALRYQGTLQQDSSTALNSDSIRTDSDVPMEKTAHRGVETTLQYGGAKRLLATARA